VVACDVFILKKKRGYRVCSSGCDDVIMSIVMGKKEEEGFCLVLCLVFHKGQFPWKWHSSKIRQKCPSQPTTSHFTDNHVTPHIFLAFQWRYPGAQHACSSGIDAAALASCQLLSP
jgi:hypothetical protein